MRLSRVLPFLLLLLVAALAFVPLMGAGAEEPASTVTITGRLSDGAGQFLGNVQLNQTADGHVSITLDASNLTAGSHGIHFHAVGKCEGPAFTTAGGHFNPAGHQHGLENPAGPHAGDLPQIDDTTVSLGLYEATTDRIVLTKGQANSIFDADGTALIVHVAADDQVTDPTGNSGARIACAVLAAPDSSFATPTATATTPVAPAPPNTGSGFAEAGDAGIDWGVILPLGALAVAATAMVAMRLARKR